MTHDDAFDAEQPATLLAIRDVARVLGVSLATARRLVRREVAHVQIGRRVRVEARVLADYIASCRRLPASGVEP